MTEPNNAVTLTVAGQNFEGWTSARITAGIDRVARDFDVSITRRWPSVNGLSRPCQQGDACVISIGGDKVLTGYIDTVAVQYNATAITMRIAGRSKTADLVDCSAADSPGQWLGQKLESIAAALVAPYGLTVLTEADTGDVVLDHQVQQGETVFESIDRLLKQRQLLATDNEAGAMVFIAPASRAATTALVFGENILEADYQGDWHDRYATYLCKGQSAGTDESFGTAATESEGSATDPAITRPRLLVVQQAGQSDSLSCEDRAAYERDLRAAKAAAVTYTVQGWRQQSGALWQPNMVVHVQDTMLGIDADRLISEVTYSIDSSGTKTTLATLPPEAHLGAQHRRKVKRKKYV